MNPEETLEINNFKAQYNSIIQRIHEANTALETSLKLRNEADAEYNHICEKITMALNTFDEVLEGAEKEKIALSDRTAAIVKGEANLKSIQLEFEAWKKSEQEKLDKEIADKKVELTDIQKLITEAKDTNSHLIGQNIALCNVAKDLYRDIELLQEDRNLIESDISAAREVHNTMSPLLDKQIEEKKEELKVLEETITEEKEKIAMPLQYLKGREQAVANRERNLNILISRFKPQWEKLNEGLEMKV